MYYMYTYTHTYTFDYWMLTYSLAEKNKGKITFSGTLGV